MKNWLKEIYKNIRGQGGDNFFLHYDRLIDANSTWKKIDEQKVIICYINYFEYQILPFRNEACGVPAYMFKVQDLNPATAKKRGTYDIFLAEYCMGQEHDMLKKLYEQEFPKAKEL